METLRAFIAVDIGDDIRGKLDEMQRKLKKVHANVRWVRPCNIHLTLAFLGDVSIELTDVIKTALDRACEHLPAFELEAAGTGFFGKPSYPRVVWAGLGGCPPLMKLQERIAMALRDEGIEFDNKRFLPHLTLGRVKGIDQHTGPLLEKLEKYKDAGLGSTLIDHIELIKSTLSPHGAEYTVVHRALLSARV